MHEQEEPRKWNSGTWPTVLTETTIVILPIVVEIETILGETLTVRILLAGIGSNSNNHSHSNNKVVPLVVIITVTVIIIVAIMVVIVVTICKVSLEDSVQCLPVCRRGWCRCGCQGTRSAQKKKHYHYFFVITTVNTTTSSITIMIRY